LREEPDRAHGGQPFGVDLVHLPNSRSACLTAAVDLAAREPVEQKRGRDEAAAFARTPDGGRSCATRHQTVPEPECVDDLSRTRSRDTIGSRSRSPAEAPAHEQRATAGREVLHFLIAVVEQVLDTP